MKKIFLASLCALGLTVVLNITDAKASEKLESNEMAIQSLSATMSPTNFNAKPSSTYNVRVGSSRSSGTQNFRFNPGDGRGEIRVSRTNAASHTFAHRWTFNTGPVYRTSARVLHPDFGMSNVVNGRVTIQY